MTQPPTVPHSYYFNAHVECSRDKEALTPLKDGTGHFFCLKCGQRYEIVIQPLNKAPSGITKLLGGKWR